MEIQTSDLSKSYGQGDATTRVLDQVSFQIPSGQFVAIMGTSGSGKTTLLNVMGGLDRQFSGTVKVGEHTLGALKERQLSRLRNERFGFVFQQFHLIDHLSAVENVMLPAFFSRQERRTDDLTRATSLLDQMGLAHKKDVRPTELSGGQKQRIAIARALFHEPAVLFCDEPTGSLDRQTGEQIMELFTSLNQSRQLTLIVVTHEEHVARMASRIIRLEDGRLVDDQHLDPAAPDASL